MMRSKSHPETVRASRFISLRITKSHERGSNTQTKETTHSLFVPCDHSKRGVDPRVGSEAQPANAKEARRLLCARVLLLHGVEVEQQVRLDERLRGLVQERDVLVLEAGEVQVLNVVLETVLGVDRVATPH